MLQNIKTSSKTIIFNRSKIYFLKFILLLLFYTASTTTNAQQKEWEIDNAHSKIGFEISYFKISTIKGTFDQYEATLLSNSEDLIDASINIKIKAASINTNQSSRDKHLRGTDFFDVEKYPEITFYSTTFTKTTIDNQYHIKGQFTMGGITQNIILNALYKGSFMHPRFKELKHVFEITGSIPREEHNIGINYPPAAMALGKDVQLIAEIQFSEKK
ncbi:YceI family protein [Aquimarina pacifica]|uniref:YceI family protein n=1 Tax=Aquimarina pacifica TaxID=1296415 RepID=UPI0004718F37|nr:YceI family protein [Aquimarina pacifica]